MNTSSKPTYSAGEPFEVKGQWWLPGKPGRQFSGTLRYSIDEIVLELDGTLDTPAVEEFVTRDEFGRIDVIHGAADCGETTLYKLTVEAIHTSSYNRTLTTYSALRAVLGARLLVPDPMIDSLSFSFPQLSYFVDTDPFDTSQIREDGKIVGLSVRYVSISDRHYFIEPIATDIQFSTHATTSETRISVSVVAHHGIVLRARDAHPLEWYLEQQWRLSGLLTLLLDEEIRPSRVVIWTHPKSRALEILYAGHRPGQEHRRAILLFYRQHLTKQFNDILRLWFSASEILQDSIDQFFVGRPSDEIGRHRLRFITLTQAIEAFSRATTDASYMTVEKFKAVESALAEAIPNSVSKSHKDALKNRIHFGNEHSLHKRLDALLKTLSQDSANLIYNSRRLFVSGIVATRNYLTHSTSELRASAFEGIELHWASERLAMLLRILLLKHLGVDEQLAVNRIAKDAYLQQIIHLYKQQPEAKV